MKIGISSYSYSRLMREGKMTLFDVIDSAKETGFDVIEFSGLHLPEGETAKSFAPKVKEKCKEVGIEVANYPIGADFLYGSDGDFKKEIERVKGEVDIAAALGSPIMRHDTTRGFKYGDKNTKSFDKVLPFLADCCREITEYAQTKGVKTSVENHGQFCQDSERVEKLVNEVNHPNFGLLVDVGNFICADEDPAVALGRLMPYAFHVHFKDFHMKPGTSINPGEGWGTSRAHNYFRGAIIGHGDVPVVQCIRILKEQKYDGVLSIEFEGIEENLLGIKIGFENLKRYIEEVK